MKQVIVSSREELSKMLDALDLTEQYYEIHKTFLMKETGLTTTSEVKPAWSLSYGEPPELESEEKNTIGFIREQDNDDDNYVEDDEDDEEDWDNFEL